MGEFASKGVAGAALGTGIGGLALGVLNGAGGLLNLMGGANCGGCGNGYAGSAMVNRYEMGLIQELSAERSENALLKADKYTDQKIVEAYKDLQGQINGVAAEVRANYKNRAESTCSRQYTTVPTPPHSSACSSRSRSCSA